MKKEYLFKEGRYIYDADEVNAELAKKDEQIAELQSRSMFLEPTYEPLIKYQTKAIAEVIEITSMNELSLWQEKHR